MSRSPAANRPQKAAAAVAHARLREALLEAQYELSARGLDGVLLLTTGLALAGRTEAISRLVQWLNPKLLSIHARPAVAGAAPAPFLRWWDSVPAAGRTSIVYDGWYGDASGALKDVGDPAGRARPQALAAIRDFEALLVHERVHLVKLHFRVPHGVQRRRLHDYLADPARSWRVGPRDLWHVQHYHAEARRLAAMRDATDARSARWQVIDSADPARSVLAAGRAVLRALERAVAAPKPVARGRTSRAARHYSLPTSASDAQQRALARPIELAQGELALQSRRHHFRNRSLLIVFEGMDAAGKSQAIRRVTAALDPRQYAVIPVGVPTPQERRYPYLHRFWPSMPSAGRIALYDRSWYGRVLVERVEGLCTRAQWLRAYREIRSFEAQLAAEGVIVIKFWLSVSRAEQLARFQERAINPAKRFKADPRDWQARRRWWEYQAAAHQMLAATHDEQAPWVVVPADDKRYARQAIVEAVCKRLRTALGPL